jgi:ADP-ribose pyrophosphatase YjhB (NUDIX family)
MWKLSEPELKLHTPIWDVMVTHKENEQMGIKGDFISLKAPNWVSAIIYNVDTDKFVMVKEYRHGINDYICEFPSGTVEDGEDPYDACRREIIEETGYNDIRCAELLFTANPNTAFMNNVMNCYYVEVGNSKVNQNLDTTEDLKVINVTFKEMTKLITEKSSVTQHLALAKFIMRCVSKGLSRYVKLNDGSKL